jgi:hypothetical protein
MMRTLRDDEENEWGVKPKANPYALKPLPRTLGGVELGESVPEVHAKFPYAPHSGPLEFDPEGVWFIGDFDDPAIDERGNKFIFDFSNGKVVRIEEPLSKEVAESIRQSFIEEYGGKFTQTRWADGPTALGIQGKLLTITDRTFERGGHLGHSTPDIPQYKPAPSTDGLFFLVSDFASGPP